MSGFSAGRSAVLPAFQAVVTMPSRERFYVELKPGETTFVSWKKLIRDVQKAGPPAKAEAPVGAHPALEARISPEVVSRKDPLPAPPNRFSSVIEKIERIYKGSNSSDDDGNLSDFPDDDQYDTQDSFIDDKELNDYFSVDKAKTKHKGFFVNRGKLERMNELAAPTVAGPKKRKKREIKKLSNESCEDISKKLHKSGARLKAAARKVPLSTMKRSASFDKAFFALSALSKPTAQKKRKEAWEPLLRHEAGKGVEGIISEDDYTDVGLKTAVINTKGTARDGTEGRYTVNTKGTARDGTEGRYNVKGAVAESFMGHTVHLDMTELQAADKSDGNGAMKRDSLVQLQQTDMDVLNLNKMRYVQKGVKDEDSREILSCSGKRHSGNARPSPATGKEISPGRPKGTIWEKAFRDLERGVAQLCPPSMVVQESEQGKRNRLPREVKQKLAKVARLAAKQGRMTDELIDRLMGMLGHVMRVQTLKRNLKEMIEMGLSAMQAKEGRLQDIKREVMEMVKSKIYILQTQNVEQRENSYDDFQPLGGSAEKASSLRQYNWDYATEDKICDLYEQYIEGMDEHRGPPLRKLYAELAELWPDGWMDNIGIKHAIHRAKERKKQQRKASSSKEESRKRQKSSAQQKRKPPGAERVAFLDLNLPDTDQTEYSKLRSHDAPENLSTSSEKILRKGFW